MQRCLACLSCMASLLFNYHFRCFKQKQAEDIWLIKRLPLRFDSKLRSLFTKFSLFFFLPQTIIIIIIKKKKIPIYKSHNQLGDQKLKPPLCLWSFGLREKRRENIKDKTWLQADNRKFSEKIIMRLQNKQKNVRDELVWHGNFAFIRGFI